MAQFDATPYRPTGLATADQALASLVQLLEWCTVLISDAVDEHPNLGRTAAADRELLNVTAGVLRDVAALLAGRDAGPDLGRLEYARAASAAHLREFSGDPASVRAIATQAFHAQAIAVAARALGADTLIATRRASAELIAVQRRAWFGEDDAPAERRLGALGSAAGLIARHASFRSAWVRNSLRGAVGLAAAVAVADTLSLQHGGEVGRFKNRSAGDILIAGSATLACCQRWPEPGIDHAGRSSRQGFRPRRNTPGKVSPLAAVRS